MLNRFLPVFFIAVLCVVILNLSCTKLDTTNLGVDIIPAVDNVNTFADTLLITSTQGIFNDSTKITTSESHVLGKISNDPLFGQSDAKIFFQLKPSGFPFYFGNAGDTIKGLPDVGVDSLVLCLSYKGAWGDTTVPQLIEVRKLEDLTFDSPYVSRKISYQPSFTGSTVIGSKLIDIRSLPNQVKFANGKDSTSYQIRIKLSDSFRDLLYSRDTSSTDFTKNAFRNDSLYRIFLKGFSVSSSSGNALMYISLTEANTRLEVHFRKRSLNNGKNKPDTVYNVFTVSTSTSSTSTPSATSNYFSRTRTPIANTGTATEHYLQATPGTYINMSVPELTGMENRIIHRASIIVEQNPDNIITDSIFSAPSYLYLDLKDTSTSTVRWKPLYFDLNPTSPYDPDFKITGYFPAGGVDFSYFGGYARRKINAIGQSVVFYDINVTRYVQQILTRHIPNYEMRLFAPYSFVYPQYAPEFIPYSNPLGYGRIRVRSGADPDPNLRMRMVLIYSKL